MKPLLVVAVLSLVVLLAAPWHGSEVPDVARAALGSEASHGPASTLALDGPHAPRAWFRPLDELLADPAHNRHGRTLSPADERLALEAFQQASAELQAIEEAFSRRQAELARAHVARGEAERFVAGRSDTSLGEHAAVRLDHDELPEAAEGRARVEVIRAHAFHVLESLLSEDGPAPDATAR